MRSPSAVAPMLLAAAALFALALWLMAGDDLSRDPTLAERAILFAASFSLWAGCLSLLAGRLERKPLPLDLRRR